MSSSAPQPRVRMPRFAEVAVERARLSVVPRVPRLRSRAPRVPFVALVSMLLLAGVVGLLLFNTSMQQASFTATRLEQQATDLSARQQGLTMELDALRDPQQLALRAKRQGLVPATGAAFLDYDSGEIIGKPTPATRAGDLPLVAPAPGRPAELDPAPVLGGTGGTGTGGASGQQAAGAQGRDEFSPFRSGRTQGATQGGNAER